MTGAAWRIVLMGVSGSGKTTIGRSLSAAVGGRFVDGDDLHPAANIEKMTQGRPLHDGDRAPWLDNVAAVLRDHDEGRPLIVACSALKRAYRARLAEVDFHLFWLTAEQDVIAARHSSRSGHFMPPELLRSQFEALEPPPSGHAVDVDRPVAAIVADILSRLGD